MRLDTADLSYSRPLDAIDALRLTFDGASPEGVISGVLAEFGMVVEAGAARLRRWLAELTR